MHLNSIIFSYFPSSSKGKVCGVEMSNFHAWESKESSKLVHPALLSPKKHSDDEENPEKTYVCLQVVGMEAVNLSGR